MDKQYWWFEGESVGQLMDQLTRSSRLEVRFHGDQCFLHVVPTVAAADTGGGIDDSHKCPPFCP